MSSNSNSTYQLSDEVHTAGITRSSLERQQRHVHSFYELHRFLQLLLQLSALPITTQKDHVEVTNTGFLHKEDPLPLFEQPY